MVSKNLSFIISMLVLTKKHESERNGTIIQFLEATIGMEIFDWIPGIDYNIINATLLVDKESPLLTIYGQRTHH